MQEARLLDRVCPSCPENALWPDMAILPEIAFWPEWQSIRIELICFFLTRNGFSAKNGFLIKKAYF